MRHKLAVVTWVDAYIDTDDFSLKDAKKAKGVVRHTAGWLVHEGEEGIVMATDYYEKKKDGFNAIMYVPWGWVEHYWEIEI